MSTVPPPQPSPAPTSPAPAPEPASPITIVVKLEQRGPHSLTVETVVLLHTLLPDMPIPPQAHELLTPEGLVPGALVTLAPALVAEVVGRMNPGRGHHELANDPSIRTALQAAQHAVAAGERSVNVFLPHPSAVRPEFERAVHKTQEAPVTKAPAISTPTRNAGVTVARGHETETPSAPEASRLLAEAAVKLPAPAENDAGLRKDHELYTSVRETLREGAERLRDKDVAPTRHLDQVVRLDRAAHEFLMRPNTPHEVAFQRALFITLLTAPTTPEQAQALLQSHFGARFGFDEPTLQKLAQAYGPRPQETKGQAPQERTLEPQQSAQAAKPKRERLPEEMLLEQKNVAREVAKPTGHRRVENILRDRQGQQQRHEEGDDEETGPIELESDGNGGG